jgi:crossover junction endodeoxyribonuclease RusA
MNAESGELFVGFFEFIVEGPPVSVRAKKTNTRRYQKWIRTVRECARKEWPVDTRPTNSTSVTVTIANYYTLVPPDVDNIIKPIMDALETVVYIRDEQVRKVISEKFDLTSLSRVVNPDAVLATGLEKYTGLLHIVVVWNPED